MHKKVINILGSKNNAALSPPALLRFPTESPIESESLEKAREGRSKISRANLL